MALYTLNYNKLGTYKAEASKHALERLLLQRSTLSCLLYVVALTPTHPTYKRCTHTIPGRTIHLIGPHRALTDLIGPQRTVITS